jgi:HK97 family phage major capsid protein|tara:strand:- start:51 stop:1097 length:1047 start_codon:yes stop_codon:yes gene_type:complete
METIKRNAAVVSGVTSNKVEKEIEDYSFQSAMRAAYTGQVEGLVKEMDQEARSNAKYTGQTFKGLAIPSTILTRAAVGTDAVNATQTMSFTDQLEANLVMASAGANFYSGIENMKFPVISGVNSYFQPEAGGTAGAANGTASSITLSPKKLISVVNVSNEALTQNTSLEAALRRNMAQSIAAHLEKALLGETDVTNGPTSIFLDAAAGSTAAFSNTTALALEASVLDAGVQLEGARMAYLMNSSAYQAIKQAAMVSGVSPVYDMREKLVNSYFSLFSSNVGLHGGTAGKDAVLFGDFSKVHIAQFGGLDILYDPYTNGATGEPRMIVTSLVDGNAVQNGAAFANLIEA